MVFFYVQWFDVRLLVIVDIGGIVDHVYNIVLM
jgi:hypothetical protein